jgi:hypothetical protein
VPVPARALVVHPASGAAAGDGAEAWSVVEVEITVEPTQEIQGMPARTSRMVATLARAVSTGTPAGSPRKVN